MEEPKRDQAAATILKYRKRRYDGGSEIELIRYIERQQTVAQLQRLQEKQREMEQAQFRTIENTITQQSAPVPVRPRLQAEEAPAPTKSQQVTEALMMGPLEICVGTVGIMTALVAIFTFTRLKNAELAAQSKVVLKDCANTFGKGLVDTVKGPIKALKVAVSR